MNGLGSVRRVLVVGGVGVLTLTGCAFEGLNSLPLPGAVGRGPGAAVYHVQIANVGSLESNSPVLIDDVVVGSVGKMTLEGWHAEVDVSVKPDVVVPANAVATVGQTSLLGSMHLALNPPVGQTPAGRLPSGATIALEKSSTYPSTEETLASLAAVVNGGGLGQIGDIIHNFNAALSGNESQIRDSLTRLDKFVGLLDEQHDTIIASIQELNRFATTFAEQRDVINQALQRIPAALDVLAKERPRITEALEKLGTFSDTATRLVNDTQADLVKNLQNLEPTIKALTDIGPDLGPTLAFALVYPFGQDGLDRLIRGDYQNMFASVDLTIPRLKRELFAGTRWGDPTAMQMPAPGEPWYLNYTYDPLSAGVLPPAAGAPPAPPQSAPVAPESGQMPPVTEPLLPVAPPPALPGGATTTEGTSAQIFAGPYAGEMTPLPPAVPGAAPPSGPTPTDVPPAPGGGG